MVILPWTSLTSVIKFVPYSDVIQLLCSKRYEVAEKYAESVPQKSALHHLYTSGPVYSDCRVLNILYASNRLFEDITLI